MDQQSLGPLNLIKEPQLQINANKLLSHKQQIPIGQTKTLQTHTKQHRNYSSLNNHSQSVHLRQVHKKHYFGSTNSLNRSHEKLHPFDIIKMVNEANKSITVRRLEVEGSEERGSQEGHNMKSIHSSLNPPKMQNQPLNSSQGDPSTQNSHPTAGVYYLQTSQSPVNSQSNPLLINKMAPNTNNLSKIIHHSSTIHFNTNKLDGIKSAAKNKHLDRSYAIGKRVNRNHTQQNDTSNNSLAKNDNDNHSSKNGSNKSNSHKRSLESLKLFSKRIIAAPNQGTKQRVWRIKAGYFQKDQESNDHSNRDRQHSGEQDHNRSNISEGESFLRITRPKASIRTSKFGEAKYGPKNSDEFGLLKSSRCRRMENKCNLSNNHNQSLQLQPLLNQPNNPPSLEKPKLRLRTLPNQPVVEHQTIIAVNRQSYTGRQPNGLSRVSQNQSKINSTRPPMVRHRSELRLLKGYQHRKAREISQNKVEWGLIKLKGQILKQHPIHSFKHYYNCHYSFRYIPFSYFNFLTIDFNLQVLSRLFCRYDSITKDNLSSKQHLIATVNQMKQSLERAR